MTLKNFLLSGALGCATVATTAFAAIPSQAACLTSNSGNTCKTYNTVGTSTAVLTYSDPKLATNQYFQILTVDGTQSRFSNWFYSTTQGNDPNTKTWTAFTPTFTVSAPDAYSQVFNIATSDEFFIKVDLSPTATLDQIYGFSLYSNIDGATTDGILSGSNGTGQTVLSRDFKRVADPATGTPGPLPLFGAAAAFGYSRKIRKSISAVS